MFKEYEDVVNNSKIFLFLYSVLVIWFLFFQPYFLDYNYDIANKTVFFEPLDTFLQSFTHSDLDHITGNMAVFITYSLLIIPFIKPSRLILIIFGIIAWGFAISWIKFGNGVGFSTEISAFGGLALALFIRNCVRYFDKKLDTTQKYILIYILLVAFIMLISGRVTDTLISIYLLPTEISYDGIFSSIIDDLIEHHRGSAVSHTTGFVFGFVLSIVIFLIDYRNSLQTQPTMLQS